MKLMELNCGKRLVEEKYYGYTGTTCFESIAHEE
jgi:hypothetical protein